MEIGNPFSELKVLAIFFCIAWVFHTILPQYGARAVVSAILMFFAYVYGVQEQKDKE